MPYTYKEHSEIVITFFFAFKTPFYLLEKDSSQASCMLEKMTSCALSYAVILSLCCYPILLHLPSVTKVGNTRIPLQTLYDIDYLALFLWGHLKPFISKDDTF